MKKLTVLAMILALMIMATAVLAAPGANSPWEPTGNKCEHPSDPGNMEGGDEYYNTKSGKTHCFKA